MDFDGNRPIYVQLYEEIKGQIVSGLLKPGDKLDSVRTLAKTFGVNPNTVQRALQDLEREALIVTDRTRGKFVTEDKEIIKNLAGEVFYQACLQLIEVAKDLNMSKDLALKLLDLEWEGKKDESH
ncbi:MAG: GntR family transcriptional regulator [Tissierellia bacterium]|nr:GntR family transcriptional regulator [Tissierellia bacterium]